MSPIIWKGGAVLTLDSTTSADVQSGHVALIRDLIKSKEKQAERYETLKRSLANVDDRAFKDYSPHYLLPDNTNAGCDESKPISPGLGNHAEQQESLANFDQPEETSLAFAHHLFSLFDRLIFAVNTPAYRIGLLSRYRVRSHIYNARSREIDQLKYLHGSEAQEKIHEILNLAFACGSVALDHDHDTTTARKRPRERSQSPDDTESKWEKMHRTQQSCSQAAYPKDHKAFLPPSLPKSHHDAINTLPDTHTQDNPHDAAFEGSTLQPQRSFTSPSLVG